MTLPRAINDAHPAPTDFFQDLVIFDAPIGIGHVNFLEYLVQRFHGFSLAAEGALQHTVQTKPTSHPRCRPTLFTRCATFVNSHRIGDVACAHRSLRWPCRQSRTEVAQLFINVLRFLYGLRDFLAKQRAVALSQLVDETLHCSLW